jgi:WD40 repeat protein
MNQPNARTLTLFDLLARRWRAAAPIADLRFNEDGSATAFATADGSVLIAAAPDAEPPESRIRISGDLGQITLRPRTADPAPLVAVSGLADAAAPLAAAEAGFLVGDADGRVLRLAADGSAEPLLGLDSAVVALDHASGVTAAADGATLTLVGPEATRRWPRPGIRTLALAADGHRLAAADATGLVILDAAAEQARPLSGATRLAWRLDGAWLAAALGAEGVALIDPADPEARRLPGFPAAVQSLAWSGPAGALVAGGAFRIAAWDATTLPSTDRALVTGQPGLVVVEAVAAHPTLPLVAAGYANGQVIVARVGSRDELLLRQDGAAVTCLAFSPDGRHLAIGDAAGTAAIASFPPQMFK